MMISVLMPVYNAERYLADALDSILAQSYTDFELIVVNDGSTDSSLRILQRYEADEARIIIISKENTGIVSALNDGLKIANGRYILRMDADDWAHPLRFQQQIRFMESNSQIVASGTYVHFTDPYGRCIKPCPRHTEHHKIEEALLEGDGGAIIHPSLIVRTDAIRKIGGYRKEFEWIEDLDLYLRLAEVGRLANLPRYLLHYRQHLNSVNATRSDAERCAKKDAIMFRVHELRGTHWVRQEEWLLPTRSELYCDWACESLGYGRWSVSLYYALRAILVSPTSRKNWQALKYVMVCGYRIAKEARLKPEKKYQIEPIIEVDQTS